MAPLMCGPPPASTSSILRARSRGGEDALLEEDVGEGRDPALVVGELADHLGAERLDAAALLLGVDDLVEVEHVGERVAALLPRLQLVLGALDRVGRQAADVVGQAL